MRHQNIPQSTVTHILNFFMQGFAMYRWRLFILIDDAHVRLPLIKIVNGQPLALTLILTLTLTLA